MFNKTVLSVYVVCVVNMVPIYAMEKSNPRMPSPQQSEIRRFPSEEEQERLVRNRFFLEEAMVKDKIPKDVRDIIAQKEYDLAHKDIIYCPSVEAVNMALKENVELFPKEPWLLIDENYPLIIVEQGFHFCRNNELTYNKIKMMIREKKSYINTLMTVKMNNSEIICTYAQGIQAEGREIDNFIEVSIPRQNEQYEIVSMEQSKVAKGHFLMSQNGQFYYNLYNPSDGINSQDIIFRINERK